MIDPGSLFAAHHQRLFRYLCRAVGDVETARDLTQDVFVRVSRTAIPLRREAGRNGQSGVLDQDSSAPDSLIRRALRGV